MTHGVKQSTAILRAVGEGYATSAELVEYLGIGRTSVTSWLTVLTRRGLLVRSGTLPARSPRPGRRAYVYRPVVS